MPIEYEPEFSGDSDDCDNDDDLSIVPITNGRGWPVGGCDRYRRAELRISGLRTVHVTHGAFAGTFTRPTNGYSSK